MESHFVDLIEVGEEFARLCASTNVPGKSPFSHGQECNLEGDGVSLATRLPADYSESNVAKKKGATQTPWGTSESSTVLLPGIVFHTTARHGGIKVDGTLNDRIPPYMRNDSGWYEEDVDWAIVATVFPEAFNEEGREQAKRMLRNWNPWAYELFYGEKIPPGKSYVKEEAKFEYEHRDDLVGIAAFGSWHPRVPEGMVGVIASPGGRRGEPGEKSFLVPAWEYDERATFGFIIDPERHEQVARFS